MIVRRREIHAPGARQKRWKMQTMSFLPGQRPRERWAFRRRGVLRRGSARESPEGGSRRRRELLYGGHSFPAVNIPTLYLRIMIGVVLEEELKARLVKAVGLFDCKWLLAREKWRVGTLNIFARAVFHWGPFANQGETAPCCAEGTSRKRAGVSQTQWGPFYSRGQQRPFRWGGIKVSAANGCGRPLTPFHASEPISEVGLV